MTMSRISKSSGIIVPKMATGSPSTIQMLKMLLPIILPTRRLCSPRWAATMVVTSSGRDVPIAIMVKEMMRSEMPIAVAMLEAEFTASWLPPIVPARPRMMRRMDFLTEKSG